MQRNKFTCLNKDFVLKIITDTSNESYFIYNPSKNDFGFQIHIFYIYQKFMRF